MISKLQRVVCHLNDRLASVEQINGISPPVILPSATGSTRAVCRCCASLRTSLHCFFLHWRSLHWFFELVVRGK